MVLVLHRFYVCLMIFSPLSKYKEAIKEVLVALTPLDLSNLLKKEEPKIEIDSKPKNVQSVYSIGLEKFEMDREEIAPL